VIRFCPHLVCYRIPVLFYSWDGRQTTSSFAANPRRLGRAPPSSARVSALRGIHPPESTADEWLWLALKQHSLRGWSSGLACVENLPPPGHPPSCGPPAHSLLLSKACPLSCLTSLSSYPFHAEIFNRRQKPEVYCGKFFFTSSGVGASSSSRVSRQSYRNTGQTRIPASNLFTRLGIVTIFGFPLSAYRIACIFPPTSSKAHRSVRGGRGAIFLAKTQSPFQENPDSASARQTLLVQSTRVRPRRSDSVSPSCRPHLRVSGPATVVLRAGFHSSEYACRSH